ncbi:T9SS type A sorting domain-containing protein [Hymenobacter jejuensis]|uniref:T9SS type A sorting domain-containing protein n=2 Tax=Hymenobacter jejuensis TaxID=2502781 RepID=A0A5B8A4B7_9BACT|nr:T9SS type A sorting domain-containing protein [Hymenobacter jejuensis]
MKITLPLAPDSRYDHLAQLFAISKLAGSRKWLRTATMLVIAVLYISVNQSFALQGATQCHDPSTIVKSGNIYWVFTTGDGVYGMYSTDLINWTPSPKPVFAANAWPGWINAKVPGFQGTFWAPECKFMNGKYYLYYSCSTFGSKVSAIGLATNATLDPTSPDYRWQDQGEVVSTNNSSDVNAIDPALFTDANGDLWLTYGSFFGGIRAALLDKTTGKPANSTRFPLASGDAEASYVVRNGNYYYLFINRGACCNGVNSTYHVQVGRSTSPSGPYLDKSNVDLNNGGGTTILSSSGKYIGPGCVGLFQENGANYLSHHYYDAEANGAPRLSLGTLAWDNDAWPVISRDWLAAGRYEIANQNSGLVWEALGCSGAAGQAITQGTKTGQNCQQWNFTALGNGDYKLTNALGDLAAGTQDCSPAAGAKLLLGAYSGAFCQRFKIERASDGSFVFSSVDGNRVVEVPFASRDAGTQLGLWDYNGCNCQRWLVNAPGATLASAAANTLKGVSIYPVPAVQGRFEVDLTATGTRGETSVEILNLQGRLVHQQQFGRQTKLSVDAAIAPGLYMVRVRSGNAISTQKVVVQ